MKVMVSSAEHHIYLNLRYDFFPKCILALYAQASMHTYISPTEEQV